MDKEEIRALAQQVLVDRLPRLMEVGVTSKGRIIAIRVGEPSEAERKWDALMARPDPGPECPRWLQ